MVNDRTKASRRTRSINSFNDTEQFKGKESADKNRKIPANMNEQEMQLCEKLCVSPHEYLVIKEVLVREAVNEGFIKRELAENILKLDKERIAGIFDFLVTHSYILEKPQKN